MVQHELCLLVYVKVYFFPLTAHGLFMFYNATLKTPSIKVKCSLTKKIPYSQLGAVMAQRLGSRATDPRVMGSSPVNGKQSP